MTPERNALAALYRALMDHVGLGELGDLVSEARLHQQRDIVRSDGLSDQLAANHAESQLRSSEGLHQHIVEALDRYRKDDGNAAQAGHDLAMALWRALPESVRGERP